MSKTPAHIVEKIRAARERGESVLNLSREKLTEIPPELFEADTFEVIWLYDNQIATVPTEVGQLEKLRRLVLFSNPLKEIVDVPGLALDFAIYQPLQHKLQRENIAGLKLTKDDLPYLSELIDLPRLTHLDLSGSELSELPESVTRLQNLTTLDLSNNQLTAVPAFLTYMPKLSTVRYKEQEDFYFPGPEEIVLSNNPITYPPKEVVAGGMEAIRAFFVQAQQQGKSKLYEAKLLLVGEPGAGKTSLMHKLLNENYAIPHPSETSTVGITVKTGWQFPLPQKPEAMFTANLWDFGGQEIQYMTNQFFLSPRALYVLVVDDRKQHTQFDYWFNIIKLLGKGSPVLVVLNERQGKAITNFDYDTYRKFYHDDFKLERCEVDLAEAGPRFVHLRNTVQRLLTQLPHIGDELPARWIDIRQALEQQRERNHITLHEFKTLCEQHGIHNEADQLTLSGYLHDLGVIMHFQQDPQLADTLFLNPQWVVAAVYSVLDSSHVKKNKGRFTKGWMFEQWQSRGHDFSECNKLLSLMLKNNFELCYRLEGGAEEEYIAPQLLPSTRPPYEWNSAGNLHFRLQYPFMPKGIITRLIVRLHEWIERESDEGLVWERGVVLRKHGVRGQVTEEITKQEGLKVINIVLDGPASAQKELLAEIRAELRAIHDKSFRGINVKEMVPIPEQPEIAVPYEHLLLLESQGLASFVPQGLTQNVSVEHLLSSIETPERRSILRGSLNETLIRKGMGVVDDFYFQAQNSGLRKVHEAKLLIVGEPGAGKTSLFRKLLNEEYVISDLATKHTVGISIKKGWRFSLKNYPDTAFSANLWDFGGHEIQYLIHQFFLTSRTLYVLVTDERKQNSNFDYWFNIIKLLGKGSPTLVVLNERDDQRITNFDHFSYKQHYKDDFDIECLNLNLAHAPLKFRHLRELIQEMLAKLSRFGGDLPANWIDVRQDLERLSKRNYITMNEYSGICRKHGVQEESAQLSISGYLHELGEIVHFQQDSKLADKIFLNPQWVVDGIYAILSSDYIKNRNGRFTKQWMFTQWAESKYNFAECNMLLSLMQKDKFELCFKLEGSMEEEYIAPQLLPNIRPQYAWNEANNLYFRFQYPFYPHGILTHLIVRLHKWIVRQNAYELVWEKGVVLKDPDNGVNGQIAEETTSKDGLKVINIVLDGEPQKQKETLAFIRAEIRSIHERLFEGISFKEMVPIPDQPEFAVSYKHLLDLESQGEEFCFPEDLGRRVSVQELLNGVEPPQKRRRFLDKLREEGFNLNINVNQTNEQRVQQNVQQSVTSTFNFTAHFEGLLGSLNELREELEPVAPEQAKEIVDLRERLKKLEGAKEEDKAKAKESTALSKTRRLLESVNDTSTALGKTVEKIKGGVGIVQDVAKHYNSIAQWCGLPQVPSVLLK